MSDSDDLVGPVLRVGELSEAVAEAAEEDNPGKKISLEEHTSYVRIQAERECIIRRATIEKMLGRPFAMQEIELNMPSFAGQIETTTEYMRFYLERP